MLNTVLVDFAAFLLLQCVAFAIVLARRPRWIRTAISCLDAVLIRLGHPAEPSSHNPYSHNPYEDRVARVAYKRRRNPTKKDRSDWTELQGPESERVEDQVISGLVNYGMKESAARKLVLEEVQQLGSGNVTFETLWHATMRAYSAQRTSPRPADKSQ